MARPVAMCDDDGCAAKPGRPGGSPLRVGVCERVVRVFLVQFPFQRIIDNIFPCAGQFMFVSDYPFVIIPLPHGTSRIGSDLVDLAGGN